MEYNDEVVRIGPSPHGLGVFSQQPLASHDLVGPIRGDVIDDADYESFYCMQVGEEVLEPRAPFRYLNHSCRPNCTLVSRIDDRAGDGSLALWVETLSAIAPGQQMTIDYNWPACAAIPCTCGAPDCRGWIVAADQLCAVDRCGDGPGC
jgi:hypothetical protein